ncbi:uncharacterized protein CANTADRAFT_91370 [Suhomyces tanzawaensis NRRL Y-17324]|uniref:Uncharacterized protein n=1 Tax=Suhomyces tanzawaensis NRRL Y-17324 TaxID=984487 RepID=A0A1E4SEV4_9ASCO|nr:uncharacterized protein CANTADRAFT_91370 [Suhomyces tanzawaensis NRRL Y-17324]ODV77922.1 hypothetical protein CANTADRAFT_91370 [Suhomyces tanzawaensis NRRL Y-17324]
MSPPPSPPPYACAPDALPAYLPPNDSLPPYKPSLEYYGLALIKTEFTTPYHYNTHDRRWKAVLLEINSTQLNIYALRDRKLLEVVVCLYSHLNSLSELINDVNHDHAPNDNASRSSINLDIGGDAYGNEPVRELVVSGLGRLRMKHKKYRSARTLHDLGRYLLILGNNGLLFEPTTSRRQFDHVKLHYAGDLVLSYTLCNLQLGEAPSLHQLISAMYKEEKDCSNAATLVRYQNVLRLRIEYKQVLLQFWSFHAMVHWFRQLTVGRDLSYPLEARVVLRLKSIPSRASSRNNALLVATAAAASYRSSDRPQAGLRQLVPSEGLFLALVAAKGSDLPVSISSASSSESVFDTTSTATAVTAATDPEPKPLNTTITVLGHQFVSYDAHHTTVEKQYISNCIPDLNSYDKWNGKSLTLSHYQLFVEHSKGKVAQPLPSDDLFIGYPTLMANANTYEKAQVERGGTCRTFLIHSGGLVSVGVE